MEKNAFLNRENCKTMVTRGLRNYLFKQSMHEVEQIPIKQTTNVFPTNIRNLEECCAYSINE